ncbi:MAG: replication factor C large subunit [Thermoprotei archaeon]|nr:MAG: replication factor C large subunit [Thermoprotei archaeon]
MAAEERRVPWVIKYRPKRIADVVNQDDAKSKFVSWLKSWPNVRKRAALLYGPPGCGKTSLVEAAANELGYDVLEMNASDFRRASDIERIAMRAARASTLFGRKRGRIILLDEVDGISGREDAGGLEALLRLIRVAENPVVMTANDPWNPNLRPLRDVSELIEFKRLSKRDVIKVLKRICTAEKIECENDALNFIAERAEGDLRGAINDLEALAEGFGRVTLEHARALLRPRDREHNPFETLRNIFMAKYGWQAKMALSQSQLDYEQAKLWIHENLPHQYSDPEDLWRAYEALSKADVYLGRIVRSGDWDLLAYAIDLMTAGVAMAAQNNPRDKYRWTKYNFPQKLLLMARTRKARAIRDDLASIVASHLHISTAVAKNEVIPLLKTIFTANPKYAARLVLGLSLSEKMVEYLAGPNKSLVMRYVEELKRLKEEQAKVSRAAAATAAEGAKEVGAAAASGAKVREGVDRSAKKRRQRRGGDLLSYLSKK